MIDGLYPNLEEVQGLRSTEIAHDPLRWLSHECSGVVESVGNGVDDLKRGDRVVMSFLPHLWVLSGMRERSGFDGAVFSREWRNALWAKFYTEAPRRQR